MYLLLKFNVCSPSPSITGDINTSHFLDFEQVKDYGQFDKFGQVKYEFYFAKFRQVKDEGQFDDFGQVEIIMNLKTNCHAIKNESLGAFLSRGSSTLLYVKLAWFEETWRVFQSKCEELAIRKFKNLMKQYHNQNNKKISKIRIIVKYVLHSH